MNQVIVIITRYAEPTLQDMASYLTVCKVDDRYYLQLSKDEENPNWHLHVGTEEQLLKLIEDIRNKE